jgi:hypothetical protein
MAKSSVQIQGLSKVLSKIREYPEAVKSEVDMLLASEANEMVNRAVNDAPVDAGFIKNGITMEKKADLHYIVSSNAGYSVYMEFGTKKKFNNPYPTLSSYVSSFKGSGGSEGGKGFYEEILAWVKRKGFASTYSVKTKKKTNSKASKANEEAAAYAIYRHILIHGVKPHPFFFKNYFIASENILKGIRSKLKDFKRK